MEILKENYVETGPCRTLNVQLLLPVFFLSQLCDILRLMCAISPAAALYKESIENNKQYDLSNKSILDLEGSDLNAIFDPIWKEHPASKKKSAISENTPNN